MDGYALSGAVRISGRSNLVPLWNSKSTNVALQHRRRQGILTPKVLISHAILDDCGRRRIGKFNPPTFGLQTAALPLC